LKAQEVECGVFQEGIIKSFEEDAECKCALELIFIFLFQKLRKNSGFNP
jgi:hypothetical protein